jgi:exopolysaccharide biosynthesis protein
VDGKETYSSSRTGMNFTELASILVRENTWIGANLDGGGSTTLVVRDEVDGEPRILNTPCGENVYISRGLTYKLRSVANHFGLRIKQ